MKILGRKKGKFVSPKGVISKWLVNIEGYGWLPEESLILKRMKLKEKVWKKFSREKEVEK